MRLASESFALGKPNRVILRKRICFKKCSAAQLAPVFLFLPSGFDEALDILEISHVDERTVELSSVNSVQT
jgi:hypothetical protein